MELLGIGGFDGNRRQMRQPLFLRFLDVAEQGASRADRERHVVQAKAAQIMQPKKFQQLPTTAIDVEIPGRPSAQAGHRCTFKESIIRNLLWVIPVINLVMGITGFYSLSHDTKRRHWGDRLADTMVVNA